MTSGYSSLLGWGLRRERVFVRSSGLTEALHLTLSMNAESAST